MTWLLAETWLFAALAFVLGALLTWLFLVRPRDRALDELEQQRIDEPAPHDTGELDDARARAAALEARLAQQDEEHRTRVGDLEADLNGSRARLADLEMRLSRQEDERAKRATAREAEFAGPRAVTAAGPYPNSAAPLPGGAAPRGFTVKGDLGAMRYHPPESPLYSATVAEVWFRTDEEAEAAGFTAWDADRAGDVAADVAADVAGDAVS